MAPKSDRRANVSGKAPLLELLGGVKQLEVTKSFNVKEGLHLMKLAKTVTFKCAGRVVDVTSKSVAVDLQSRELLSQGAYGQRLSKKANGAKEGSKEASKEDAKERKDTKDAKDMAEELAELAKKRAAHHPPIPPPGGPDKHVYRPASKSGAMKCAACQCYSKGLAMTGRCACGKKRKGYMLY